MAMILALFVVSCGGGSKDKENDQTDTDTEQADTEQADTGSSDTGDTGSSDTGADTGDTAPADNSCKLTLLTSNEFDRYVSFKGAGKINADINDANASEASLNGVDVKDLDADFSYNVVLFGATEVTEYDNSTGKPTGKVPGLDLVVFGDPVVDSTGQGIKAMKAIVAETETELFLSMKEYPDELEEMSGSKYDYPSPLQTQMLEIVYSDEKIKINGKDASKYAMQCIHGMNKFVATQGGYTARGTTRVCYDNNNTFAAGETLQVAMIAEFMNGKEVADWYNDVEAIEDLCFCFDNSIEDDETTTDVNESAVDCATIAEFKELDPCNPQFRPYPCSETAKCKKADNSLGYVCEGDCPKHAELKEGTCVCGDDYVMNEDSTRCLLNCDAAAHKEVAENGYECVCMEGYELKDGACVEKGTAPATDEAACTTAGGTWAESTCNCGEGKTWNATAKTCDAE